MLILRLRGIKKGPRSLFPNLKTVPAADFKSQVESILSQNVGQKELYNRQNSNDVTIIFVFFSCRPWRTTMFRRKQFQVN